MDISGSNFSVDSDALYVISSSANRSALPPGVARFNRYLTQNPPFSPSSPVNRYPMFLGNFRSPGISGTHHIPVHERTNRYLNQSLSSCYANFSSFDESGLQPNVSAERYSPIPFPNLNHIQIQHVAFGANRYLNQNPPLTPTLSQTPLSNPDSGQYPLLSFTISRVQSVANQTQQIAVGNGYRLGQTTFCSPGIAGNRCISVYQRANRYQNQLTPLLSANSPSLEELGIQRGARAGCYSPIPFPRLDHITVEPFAAASSRSLNQNELLSPANSPIPFPDLDNLK